MCPPSLFGAAYGPEVHDPDDPDDLDETDENLVDDDAPVFGAGYVAATHVVVTRRDTRRVATSNLTHGTHVHHHDHQENTMTVIDDLKKADLGYAIANTEGMNSIAQMLASVDQRLARTVLTGDTSKLIVMAHDLADALCVLVTWNRADDARPSLDHINMKPKDTPLRGDHVTEDVRTLVDATRVDLTCAINCALKSSSVGLISDLMSIALRREQFVEAAKLLKTIETDPSKAVSYGIPVKVVHCVPENLVELIDTVSALNTDVVKNIQTSEHKVFADIVSDGDTYVTTDITDAYLVDVMGEVSIVDEETLASTYTWRN